MRTSGCNNCIIRITELAREPVTATSITHKQTHAAPVAPLVAVGVPGAAAAAAGAYNIRRRLARRAHGHARIKNVAAAAEEAAVAVPLLVAVDASS